MGHVGVSQKHNIVDKTNAQRKTMISFWWRDVFGGFWILNVLLKRGESMVRPLLDPKDPEGCLLTPLCRKRQISSKACGLLHFNGDGFFRPETQSQPTNLGLVRIKKGPFGFLPSHPHWDTGQGMPGLPEPSF